ncbi:MAG TPA: hypothetical protein VIG24_05840 [Acidimicrobiia bacterium]
MGTRGFLSRQLLEAETELAAAGDTSDKLGFDIGDHADAIHFDDADASGVEDWLNTIRLVKYRLDRAEGLLRAYDLHRKANQGE